MQLFKEIMFWFGCFCAFCALFTVFSFLIFSVKDRKKSKPIMSDWQASAWQKNGAAKIRKMVIVLLLLSGSSYAQNCGYDYITDTTYKNEITCRDSIVNHSYTCYVGWWIFRKKSTCYNYDTIKICDTLLIPVIIKDSTPKVCNTKPPMSGLAIRQETWFNSTTPDTAWLNAFGNNIVVRVYLKDIAPQENIFEFAYLHKWVDFANKYGSRLKFRIVPGAFAPDWLLKKCGGFPLDNTGYETTPGYDYANDSCVKFWTPEYLGFWDRLMAAMATEFDTVSCVSEIVVSATAPGTGEAMTFAVSNSGAGLTRLNQYMNAGATDVNVKNALFNSIDAMQVWKQTNVGMALSPYEHLTYKTYDDIEVTKEIGEYLAKTFGSRAVLGNNGLRTAAGVNGDQWQPGGMMYNLQLFYLDMHLKYGSAIYNQTASEKQMGGYTNLMYVMNAGVDYGDILIELPDTEKGIKANFTNEQLRYYRELCKKNN